jgi:hypothetical protein
MTVTVPIFTKLMPTQQLFIMNSYTEFQYNLTNGLVINTNLQRDGLINVKTWSPHKIFSFHFKKNQISYLEISLI